jgi:cell division protein FtsB
MAEVLLGDDDFEMTPTCKAEYEKLVSALKAENEALREQVAVLQQQCRRNINALEKAIHERGEP